jgi:acyl-CoA synthetase (NDP forming)
MGELADPLPATDVGQRGDLSALFAPRSIAFVGASERLDAPATRGLRHCLRLGFEGSLFAVNPKYSSLLGVPCVPSVEALVTPPDLAVIALPAEGTLDAVKQCARLGVRAAVICSSGWGEIGEKGRQREAALRAILSGSSMRVLGPNCIGVGRASTRVCVAYNSSFEHLAFRHVRPIGVACQSGAMLGGLLLNAEDAGVGVEAFAHVGNGVDISLEEAAAYLLEQPGIRSLALMIEGLSDGTAFVALARRARELGKAIAVFKSGVSEAGSRAVRSHTGAMSGADAIFDAVCRDEGVTRVEEPEDLLPVARMLSRQYRPAGRRVLVFTLSGGGASVLADELTRSHLVIPDLTAMTRMQCDALGNPFIRAANPFDVGGSVFSDADAPRAALAIAVRDPNIDAVCWIGVGAPRDERSNQLLAGALSVLADCGKPSVVVPMSGTVVESGFAPAHDVDVPVARSVRSAALIVSAAVQWGPAPATVPEEPSAAALPASGRLLSEADAKDELRRAGLSILETSFVTSVDEVRARAATMPLPVVLKGIARGVAHKTELGLVRLNLRSADEAAAAARTMLDRNPGLVLDGFTLEQQLEDGIETVVGVRVDEQFGPMLMFGLGGSLVELLHDVAFTACPCTTQRAHELIGRTHAAPLLAGYRGRPPADIDALVRCMVQLSEFAARHADRLAEVEINPLIVLRQGQGAYAVDALIAVR